MPKCNKILHGIGWIEYGSHSPTQYSLYMHSVSSVDDRKHSRVHSLIYISLANDNSDSFFQGLQHWQPLVNLIGDIRKSTDINSHLRIQLLQSQDLSFETSVSI